MKCDASGNVWVTAPAGIWVYNPSGRLIGKVAVPELVANIHWGGEDWRTLFICATHSPRAQDLVFLDGKNGATTPVMRHRLAW
jgi:gluconolactonase